MVVLFLANFVKGSLQDEVDQFFQAILKRDTSRRIVTRSAICQARKKLSYKVFIGLLDLICRFLNRRSELKTYQGSRVFAMDGSTMLLPNTSELRDYFGKVESKTDSERAIARVSILHDVLNRVTYDAILGGYKTSEQTLAWDHLETAQIPKKSILLMDRGYVSFLLLRHIQDLGHRFCVRARADLKVVKLLEESGAREGVFTFKPSKHTLKKLCTKRLAKPIRVRVMRFSFGKETVYLMTNLLGIRKHPMHELAGLYHQRWQVEESYKVKKCRLKVEQFSGFSPENVQQDFHAKVFSEALASTLALEASEHARGYSETTEDEYCVSLTQVLAKMKNTLVLLFLRSAWRSLLEDLQEAFQKSLVARVPGRRAKRKPKAKSAPRSGRLSPAYAFNR